jgi:hypothetical protein
MFDIRHLESLLKINGIEKTSPDEQIRSVLLSARFKEDEVETALMVLRENVQTKQTKIDGLHKVFRSDGSLKPEEISQLLGIDVDIKHTVAVSERKSRHEFTLLQFIILWITSIILAVAGVLFFMYSHQMGVFHPMINIALHQ